MKSSRVDRRRSTVLIAGALVILAIVALVAQRRAQAQHVRVLFQMFSSPDAENPLLSIEGEGTWSWKKSSTPNVGGTVKAAVRRHGRNLPFIANLRVVDGQAFLAFEDLSVNDEVNARLRGIWIRLTNPEETPLAVSRKDVQLAVERLLNSPSIRERTEQGRDDVHGVRATRTTLVFDEEQLRAELSAIADADGPVVLRASARRLVGLLEQFRIDTVDIWQARSGKGVVRARVVLAPKAEHVANARVVTDVSAVPESGSVAVVEAPEDARHLRRPELILRLLGLSANPSQAPESSE